MSNFARLASFQGRGPVSTFWWAVLGAALVALAPVSSDGLLSLAGLPNWHPLAVIEGPGAGWAIWQQAVSMAYLVALIPTTWLLLAALVRRCHDRNRGGVFLLALLVPVLQVWPLIELGLLRGAQGENDFGLPDERRQDPDALELEPLQPVQVVPTPYVAPDPFAQDQVRAPHHFDEAPLALDDAAPEAARPVARKSGVPLILVPLVKYARFDGRATRSEYWLFLLFQWAVVAVVFFGLSAFLPREAGSAPFLLMGVGAATIGLLLPSLAVTARRLHDSGLSFAWWLVAFIPVVGGVINLVLMCLAGTRGGNAYGPDPRETRAEFGLETQIA